MSREDSRRRAERAHRLRALGRTWAEIADSEGFRSRGAARTAVQRYLDSEPGESVDEVRRSAGETLRITRSVLMGRFADASRRGDDDMLVKLSREVHRNLSQWAQLTGANSPERHQVEAVVATTTTDLLDQLEAKFGNVIDGEVLDQ
ncbi:hypothetical protein [Gordonia sp. SL306]|uniref:hypothetical protein n=1 Tax=Gordonia sp. SL306 TaxID=2995145 RepID=UPI00226FECEB|nr:hypothetical protein [Gordonia sp. SL306]WAC55170.1 hypothetical protein OVA31_21510 [Gordonia sp. SL306]